MPQPPHPLSRLALADTPNSVNWARRHTVDVLTRWHMPSDVIQTMRLLVSELATNAVRHSEKKEGVPLEYSQLSTVQTFELALEIVGAAVRVSVWDRDPTPPVLKQVGGDATGGRGVFIVAMMSDNWGHYPARALPGKVVWAEVSLAPGSADSTARSPSKPSGAEPPSAGRADPLSLGRVLVGLQALPTRARNVTASATGLLRNQP